VENLISLEGPVLKVNGELMLLIPLVDGGSELVECSRGISEIQGEFLKIVIPEWLAGMLRIEEGDLVSVQSDGKLHIRALNPRQVHWERRRAKKKQIPRYARNDNLRAVAIEESRGDKFARFD
jgi:antitoxin component of MazEF toxin-antitoxin module